MLRPGARVAAAVSGGADSVFLLAALLEIAPRVGAAVSGVAHLNHKLRGQASDAEECFVAALAARHGIPFYREEARIAEAPGNLEQAARQARMNFFEGLIRAGKADRIATGHTLDDQAETVLFRMLRGSGLAGLASILPVTRRGLIRPLLDTSRAEIEDFLRSRGIEWCEDASNHDARFARNRIRHQLLPQLEHEWNPQLRQTLARTANLAGQEELWWKGQVARLAREHAVEAHGGIEIRAGFLARLPQPVARRMLRYLAGRVGSSADFAAVEKTLELARSLRGSARLELPGIRVIRSFDWLRFEPRNLGERAPEAVRIEIVPGFDSRYPWNGGLICFQAVGSPAFQCGDSGQGEVSGKTAPSGCVRLKWKGSTASACLELRGWKQGDHYWPCGASRDQKLKEMFQAARIPSWKRKLWPIVTNGSKILWSRRFGAAVEAAPAGVNFDAGQSAGWMWLRIWEEPSPKDGKKA